MSAVQLHLLLEPDAVALELAQVLALLSKTAPTPAPTAIPATSASAAVNRAL